MKYYKDINQRKIQAGIEFYKMLLEEDGNTRKSMGKDEENCTEEKTN